MLRKIGLVTFAVGSAVILLSLGLSCYSNPRMSASELASIHGAAAGCDYKCKQKNIAVPACYKYGGDFCDSPSDCGKDCYKLYGDTLSSGGSNNYYRETNYCTRGYTNVCINGYCEYDEPADCGTYYKYYGC